MDKRQADNNMIDHTLCLKAWSCYNMNTSFYNQLQQTHFQLCNVLNCKWHLLQETSCITSSWKIQLNQDIIWSHLGEELHQTLNVNYEPLMLSSDSYKILNTTGASTLHIGEQADRNQMPTVSHIKTCHLN